MSLLNPSPGEIIDRLSILELKIPAFQKGGVPAEYLEAEKASLQDKMQEWDFEMRDSMPVNVTWDMIAEMKNALAAFNALLWKAEDDARMTPEEDIIKLARLCKHIASMNDARSRAIKRLNDIYGIEGGQEKIYAHKNFLSDETLGVE